MTLAQDEQSSTDTHFVWTTEQVIGLAPDKYHIRTSRGFAVPEKWKQLGRAGQTIWGVFPIKGKPSLFISVELDQFSLSCRCKSRKHPCNHLLSLLLLFVEAPGAFVENEIPEEYETPADGRARKRKSDSGSAKKQPAKPRSAELLQRDIARREERRKQNISAGLLELELWLHDMVEHGLAAVQDYPKKYWTNMADRLVDYQVSELAYHIRSMSLLPGKAVDWHDTLLQRISWLYLLIQGFKRYDDLSLEMQMDLRLAVGWMPRLDEAITNGQEQTWQAVSDSWVIVGKQMDLRGKQTIQRTWLWGERSNRAALLLDVIQGTQTISPVYIVGTTIDAALYFAPSTTPLYAQIGPAQIEQAQTTIIPPAIITPTIISRKQSERFVAGYDSIAAATGQYRSAITSNPWLRYFPVAFNHVTIEAIGNRWGIRDVLPPSNVKNSNVVNSNTNKSKNGQGDFAYLLPLPDKFEQQWHLQALSHLQPLSLFGEWDGEVFAPLSIWYDNRLIELRVLGGTI